jgi:hypothetical protein
MLRPITFSRKRFVAGNSAKSGILEAPLRVAMISLRTEGHTGDGGEIWLWLTPLFSIGFGCPCHIFPYQLPGRIGERSFMEKEFRIYSPSGILASRLRFY